MVALNLAASGAVEPPGARACPYCGRLAEVVGVADDEPSTNELLTLRCVNHHEWVQPSRQQILRSIGWGHEWRERRDRYEGVRPAAPPLLQQITPIVDL